MVSFSLETNTDSVRLKNLELDSSFESTFLLFGDLLPALGESGAELVSEGSDWSDWVVAEVRCFGQWVSVYSNPSKTYTTCS